MEKQPRHVGVIDLALRGAREIEIVHEKPLFCRCSGCFSTSQNTLSGATFS
jgi:hypothetical protein